MIFLTLRTQERTSAAGNVIETHRAHWVFQRVVSESRAYQTSVTLPAIVIELPLWIWIVSALATWMSTRWLKSMNTMWVPAALLNPWVMAALGVDSKPTHSMKVLGICNK